MIIILIFWLPVHAVSVDYTCFFSNKIWLIDWLIIYNKKDKPACDRWTYGQTELPWHIYYTRYSIYAITRKNESVVRRQVAQKCRWLVRLGFTVHRLVWWEVFFVQRLSQFSVSQRRHLSTAWRRQRRCRAGVPVSVCWGVLGWGVSAPRSVYQCSVLERRNVHQHYVIIITSSSSSIAVVQVASEGIPH